MTSKRLLGFLIPAFIASLIYGYLQMPQQERVATGDDKAMPRPQAKKKQPGQTSAAVGREAYPRLRSDLLERKSRPYPGVRRDLFSAAFVSGQGAEIEILPEEQPEVIAPPVVVAVAPPPPPPPSPQVIVQQELALYKFVGFFKKREKRTIFLSSNDEVFLVHQGDYLGRDRKFYVVNITETNMVLRKDGAGDFSIKLTDQEPLSAVPLRESPVSPVNSGRAPREQESYLPDQPESLPGSDEELPTEEDQLQPEEDNK